MQKDAEDQTLLHPESRKSATKKSPWFSILVIVTLGGICACILYFILSSHNSPPPPLPSYERPCMGNYSSFPFCQTHLPISQRVDDLISRLSLQEKANQTVNSATSIPRLGIPEYQWWNEALHGVLIPCEPVTKRCSTSYPAGIGLGATFNRVAISDEARAFRNADVHSVRDSTDLYGLDVWTPNINIFRDPRWGRGQECPGEDPFLNGEYGRIYSSALEGNGEVAATMKHFDAYSLEDWKGIDRHHFDYNISKQDLAQTYLFAFEKTVKAGIHGVMCSYNKVGGIPMCAHPMLQSILRDEWQFIGYVVSDCDAIDDIWRTHKYVNDSIEATAVSIKAGTDCNCGKTYQKSIVSAIQQGLLTEADVDVSLRRLYSLQMQLGLFDPLDYQPYAQIPVSTIASQTHQDISLQAARESIVLLKNEPVQNKALLPIKSLSSLNIAVIGPLANATIDMCSNYIGSVMPIDSPLAVLSSQAASVIYEQGCDIIGDYSNIPAAVNASKDADLVLVFVGLNQKVERESLDRVNISLPGFQHELIQSVFAVNQRMVIVMINGGAVAIDWESASVPAILEAFYPSQSGGHAIVDVLTGRYNPAGRLPMTMYQSSFVNEIKMTSMNMREGKGKTYRFFQGDLLFPFGFGLSYTTFAVTIKNHSAAIVDSAQQFVSFVVSVTNTGSSFGDFSALAFVSAPLQTDCPRVQLFDFTKFSLQPKQTQSTKITVSGLSAMCVNDSGVFYAPTGKYAVHIGDSLNALASASFDVV